MLDAAAAPVSRAVAVAPLAASPAPLLLACTGSATNPLGNPGGGGSGHKSRAKAASKKGSATTPADDDRVDPASVGATTAAAAPAGRSGGTAVEFTFELAGDSGRVRYPAAIIPMVHSGGDAAGWWPIRDLLMGDDAVSGRVALNFVNHARFVIDRRTGTLAVRGLQANVTGHCAKADPDQRLF